MELHLHGPVHFLTVMLNCAKEDVLAYEGGSNKWLQRRAQ